MEIQEAGGGGGAGAGIGGNGGQGGKANSTFTFIDNNTKGLDTNSGEDGKAGEKCGTICIFEDLEIYAYGGAGGAGGIDTSRNSGSGAGGYPAAGIGGGGAGGGRWRPCLWSWWIYCWK